MARNTKGKQGESDLTETKRQKERARHAIWCWKFTPNEVSGVPTAMRRLSVMHQSSLESWKGLTKAEFWWEWAWGTDGTWGCAPFNQPSVLFPFQSSICFLIIKVSLSVSEKLGNTEGNKDRNKMIKFLNWCQLILMSVSWYFPPVLIYNTEIKIITIYK